MRNPRDEPSSSSSFVLICLQLNAAQVSAITPEAREAADAEMGHFLRMSNAGRFEEWLASHPEYTTTTTDLTRIGELDEGPTPQHAPTDKASS